MDPYNVKYSYDRKASAVFYRNSEGNFDKLSLNNGISANDSCLTDVKTSGSPNLKQLVIIVVVTGLCVTIVASVTAGIVIATRDDSPDGPTGPPAPPDSNQGTTTTTASITEGSSVWSSWGEWTQCTVSCGSGLHTRNRECVADDSSKCVGDFIQSDSCSLGECTGVPEDLFWSTWGEWTKCTVSCGYGFHTRYRKCTGTERCFGDYIETDVCNVGDCPERGKWTTWTAWGSCDVTCGGGLKSRTRECVKNGAASLECVGDDSKMTQCNDFQCPDCSKNCDVGQLNEECTACVCLDNTVKGRIRSAETGNSISNVAIYDIQAPTRVLALSNNTGFFEVTTVCSTTSLLVKRTGYLDLETQASESFLDLNMESTVLPYLTETPQSKARLTGEDVMLCCKAEGKPDVIYYEWFKDEILISEAPNLDTNGSSIILVNVSSSDAGHYQCRANSELGGVMADSATITVEEKPDDFCVDALRPKSVDLPSDCVQSATNRASYEVGQCVAKPCSGPFARDGLQCREDNGSCCTVSESRIEQVNCTEYSIDIIVTVSCGCGECQIGSRIIAGLVSGLDSGSPIRFATVKVNGKVETYTSLYGRFQLQADGKTNSLVITVEDYYKDYLPATKIITLGNSYSGILNVEIKMIPVPEPQILDSEVDNTLLPGFMNNGTSKVELVLPANSFHYANGSEYVGKVQVKFTYLDPVNLSNYDNIPGTFQFTNEVGFQSDLETLGVFNIILESEDGQNLQLSEVIDAYIPSDLGVQDSNRSFKLWSLNSQTGLWEDATVFQPYQRRKRSKRETAKWIGQLENVSARRWYNYDEVSEISSNQCHFKIRLYKTPMLQETIEKPDHSISLRIHIKRGEILHTIKHEIYTVSSYFVNTVCDNDEALIEAYTYVDNNLHKLYVSSPSPVSSEEYTIASDERAVKIKLKASNTGLFTYDKFSGINSYLPFFYGLKNERSWIYKVDPLKECNPSSDIASNYLRWYSNVPKAESIRSCMVKIKTELSVNANVGPVLNLKLRVTSFTANRLKVFGVHEISHALSKMNPTETSCVEYRCSGTNDPCSHTEYFTHVKIAVEHDNKYLTFFVKQQAVALTNTTCGDPQNYLNTDQVNRSDGAFEFCAPILDGSVESGLYTQTDRDIEKAKSLATDYCKASKIVVGENQPNIGLAVTFVGK